MTDKQANLLKKIYIWATYITGFITVITRIIVISCIECKTWLIIANIFAAIFLILFASGVVWVIKELTSE